MIATSLGFAIAALGLYLLNLFLWSGQSAFAFFPKPSREELAEDADGDSRSAMLLELLDQPHRVDAVIRFLNIAVRIGFVVALFLAAHRLGSMLDVPLAITVAAHLLTATLLLTPGEMIARSYGIQNAASFAMSIAPVVYGMMRVAGPPLAVLVGILKRLGERFGIRRSVPFLTVEEMLALVEAGEEEGEIEDDEREMIHAVFELGDTTVREIMVPRVDMITVESTSPISDALEKVITGGHSRIPVWEESVDTIVGVVYAKDLLEIARDSQWELPVRDVMREPYFVPEGKTIDDLLADLRRERVHLAVVVDEYGGTAGLVTLEDALEEIVGEIHDEYDPDEILFQREGDDAALADAKISIDDLNERFNIGLSSKKDETLGGYLYSLIDRVPREGETVQENGLDFRVEKVDRQRISLVRIRKRPESDTLLQPESPGTN